MHKYLLQTAYVPLSSDSGVYYNVIDVLGWGGNSEVYLVVASSGPFQGLLFALKLFVKVNDATRLTRFNREIEFLSSVNHPSLLRVYDKGKTKITIGNITQEYPFAIFEYLPQTLHDALRTGLTMVEKAAFALQLISGLRFLSAEDLQIVHRDIKMKNVFVRGKSCILGDFGLMKPLMEEAPTNDKEFVLESIGPRMPWVSRSPDLVEYCLGEADLTVKSDVFQLGLVLAEMFSGQSPLRKARNRLDKVRLNPIELFGGSEEKKIIQILDEMLTMEVEDRPFAEDLTDGWEGVFRGVVKLSQDLEGTVFL